MAWGSAGAATMAGPGAGLRRACAALLVLVASGSLSQLPMTRAAASSSPMQAVIVRGVAGGEDAVARAVSAVGGSVTQQLGLIEAVTARVPSAMIATLRHSAGVLQVTPDVSIHLLSSTYDPSADIGSLYNTSQLTGAQAMWGAGYTGKGVDVALIDSGVSPVAGLNAADKLVNGPDLSFESQAPNLAHLDTYGHGTFMAGIIGGRDVAGLPAGYSSNSTNFNGIAPDARILSVKVADSNGMADVSQVIAAISWVVQHRTDNGLNVRVMNLSFATDSSQSEILDPLSFAVEHAWKSGIVVVASAGNAGWNSGGLVNPAYNPFVIAVAASDPRGTLSTADDTIAPFSSAGGHGRNPDLAAPGKSMVSLRDPGSYIDHNYASTGAVTSRFFRGSGTSESAAVVSGAAALLLQQRPQATPDQVKAILKATATPLAGQPVSLQGNGELNLAAAKDARTPLLAVQTWPPATGLGSVENSRGSVHLSMAGVRLDTDVDIFGVPFGTDLVSAIINDAAWTGGDFNGTTWSGTTWSGTTWSGTTWSGTTWSGTTWSGTTWSSNTWNGTTWSGTTWSGTTWSGTTWSGTTWS
ncbi:MAG: hypothetical protein NVS3B24_09020 [Candidatus Dormibacteria bacterium]